MGSLTDALREDAQRMEDAACDLTMDRRYSIYKITYWLCVAVLHITTWILKERNKNAS